MPFSNRLKVEQKSVGKFEIPNWDTVSQDKIRAALKVLSATMENYDGAFGSKDEVNPVKFLFASATGWGGNPQKDAMYAGVTPEMNDGKTAYTLNVKDVPVDGFWSISLYNEEGYFQENKYNAYSVNNITGKKNDDGSMTIHFGGDPKQPNFLPIMDGWNYLVRLYQPRKEIHGRQLDISETTASEIEKVQEAVDPFNRFLLTKERLNSYDIRRQSKRLPRRK